MKKINALCLWGIPLLLLLTSCSLSDSTTKNFKTTVPGEKNQECPNLESQLLQLIDAENPIQAAEKLGLAVRDGKVQVLLVLAEMDTTLPEGFELEIGTRSGDQVQVYALFDQLCALANTNEVIAIRLPAQHTLP